MPLIRPKVRAGCWRKISMALRSDTLPNPLNAYGKSKLMGEIELNKNCEKYYLVRTAWLYGGKGAGKRSFIDLMLEKAEKGESIDAIDDEFSNPTYVVDLAQAAAALVEQKKPFGIYHLTNSGQTSWYDDKCQTVSFAQQE